MSIFGKKETTTQNITFMGIMAAINIVLVLISYFVPYLLILLVLVLPMTSTLVTILCKKRYYLYYVVATIAISILATMRNFSDTFVFIIPSLLSGFVFGYAIDKQISCVWVVFFITVIVGSLFYAFVPLVNLIYSQDLIKSIATIFGLNDYKYLDIITPLTVYFIAGIQAIISYFLGKLLMEKMNIKVNDEINIMQCCIGGFLSLIVQIIFVFCIPNLSYVLSLPVIYFSTFIIIKNILKLNKISLCVYFCSFLITIAFFGIFYNSINKPYGLLLINVFFDLVLLATFINKCFNMFIKRDKINNNI